MIICLSFAVMY